MFADMQAQYHDMFKACDCNTMQRITPRERCLHVQVCRGAAGGQLHHVAETYGGGEEAWVVSFPLLHLSAGSAESRALQSPSSAMQNSCQGCQPA